MATLRTNVDFGVETLELSNAVPNEDGIVASVRLDLPRFRRAVYFSADHRGDSEGWPADANRELPWVVGESFAPLLRTGSGLNRAVGAPNRSGLGALIEIAGGGAVAVLTAPGARTVSVLHIEDDGGLAVRALTLGTEPVSGTAPLFAFGTAATPAAAFRRAWQAALDSDAVAAHTGWRWEKSYGEPFEYLGWCSWEHFHKDIDATVLADSIGALNDADVPVRWALIDDGHQTCSGRRLTSLAPDPEKFPDGWNPLFTARSRPEEASSAEASDNRIAASDPGAVTSAATIRWLGLWHAFQGLWDTVGLENDLGELNDYLSELPSGGYLPRGDEEAARRFYDALVGSAAEAGFDFVKIDVQAANLRWYAGTANAVTASARSSRALEAAVAREIPHGMINCMAHNALCLFNTAHSAVTRCSIDYHLNDADSISSHILQSYTNTLWIGWSVWPDHDMFHSSDREAGRMMAVSKALSGAPIYLSDAPRNIDVAIVKPLCLADGRLLRPLAPAAPTPDSTFLDALNDSSRPYVVVAPLANGCAAVAAYNLVQPKSTEAAETVPLAAERRAGDGVSRHARAESARVGATEYNAAGMMLQDDSAWSVPEEGLVAYDWYRGVARRLAGRADESPSGGAETEAAASTTGDAATLTVELGYLEDALVLLAPVTDGWAVFGREDKYLGPAAVLEADTADDSLQLSLLESGPTLVWSDPARGGVDALMCGDCALEDLGGGLFRLALPVEVRALKVTVRRRVPC